ncbi:MAG: hypothetical protein L3J51_04085 [Cocleimonas sp.]|nr:hypothetical protein [Cocleimonas sp.]
MKKIIQLGSALFVSIVITACGGGGTDTAGNNDPANPPTESGKLIIDNGRGTTNNQDTERVK